MLNLEPTGTTKVAFFVPFAKIVDDSDACVVSGYASTPDVDSEGEIVTLEALEAALPEFMFSAGGGKPLGNLREMHQLSAVGVIPEANIDARGLYIKANVVDPTAVLKVRNQVYRGFSIGGNATERVGNKITGLKLVEISLVDRPACPSALIDYFKIFEFKEAIEDKETPVMATKEELVEAMARQLCKADGADPDKVLATSATNGTVLKWHTFKDAAEGELKKGIVPDAFKPPEEQEAAPDTDELRRTLVSAIDALGPEQLQAAVVAFKAQTGTKAAPDANVAQAALKALAKRYLALSPIQHNTPALIAKALGITEAALPDVIDAASELQKQKPIVKADDAKPDTKPYGDVAYADPGYQEDKKKRYPIDTEKHIRAAWNYINKDKNHEPYTAEQVDDIKSRVVAAWKKTIDKDGPPSAEDGKSKADSKTSTRKGSTMGNSTLEKLGKPDAQTSIKKGLMTVTSVLCLLENLDRIHESLVAEEAIEGDGSSMPDRFKSLVQMLGSLAEDLLSEEMDEMMSNTEMEDFQPEGYYGSMPMGFCMAATPTTRKRMAARLEKAMGDNTGAPGYLTFGDIATHIEKGDATSGVPQTQTWGDRYTEGTDDHNDSWNRAAGMEKVDGIHKAAGEILEHCNIMRSMLKGAKITTRKAKKTTDIDENIGDEQGSQTRTHTQEDLAMDKMSDDHEAFMGNPDAQMPKGGKKGFQAMSAKDRDTHMKNNPIRENPPEAGDAEPDEDDQKKAKESKGGKKEKAAQPDFGAALLALTEQVSSLTSTVKAQIRNPPPKGQIRAVNKADDTSAYQKPNPVQEAANLETRKAATLDAIWGSPQVLVRSPARSA